MEILGIGVIAMMVIVWVAKSGLPKTNEIIYYLIGGVVLILLGLAEAFLAGISTIEILILKRVAWATVVTVWVGYAAMLVGLSGFIRLFKINKRRRSG